MKKNNTKNAVFLQRLCAYLIDAIVISLCASLIASPFINSKSIEKIDNQLQEVVTKLQNGDIGYRTYASEVAVLGLESGKQGGILTIVTIFLELLYFVVFQLHNSGQTIGKKLLNIKVVSNSGDLTMNQLVIRSLLINSILLSMITLIIVIVVNDPMQYLYIQGSFESIQYLFIIITASMVMFRKDHLSLHDLITNTKVVKI